MFSPSPSVTSPLRQSMQPGDEGPSLLARTRRRLRTTPGGSPAISAAPATSALEAPDAQASGLEHVPLPAADCVTIGEAGERLVTAAGEDCPLADAAETSVASPARAHDVSLSRSLLSADYPLSEHGGGGGAASPASSASRTGTASALAATPSLLLRSDASVAHDVSDIGAGERALALAYVPLRYEDAAGAVPADDDEPFIRELRRQFIAPVRVPDKRGAGAGAGAGAPGASVLLRKPRTRAAHVLEALMQLCVYLRGGGGGAGFNGRSLLERLGASGFGGLARGPRAGSSYYPTLAYRLAFHPRGDVLAVIGADDVVYCFSTRAAAWLPRCTFRSRWARGMRCAAFRPHGAPSLTLAAGCARGVALWRRSGSARAGSEAGRYYGVGGDRVSSSSMRSSTLSPSSSDVVFLERAGHACVSSIAWRDDGALLASASPLDRSVLVWNVATRESQALYRVCAGSDVLRWAAGGRYLAANMLGDDAFRVWHASALSSFRSERWTGVGKPVNDICWARDDEAGSGHWMLCASDAAPAFHCLHVGAGANGADAQLVLIERTLDVPRVMRWDPSGERVAIAFRNGADGDNQDGIVALYASALRPHPRFTLLGYIRGPVDCGAVVDLAFRARRGAATTPQSAARGDGGRSRRSRSAGSRALLAIAWGSGTISFIPLLS